MQHLIVPRGRRSVKISWSKLVTMTKQQREHAELMLAQQELAKDPEVAQAIIDEKAKRKAAHIARMKEVAAGKKRR